MRTCLFLFGIACLMSCVLIFIFGDRVGFFIRHYMGDVLVASLIYFFIAALFWPADVLRAALLALAFCFSVESMQLIKTPWLKSLRQSPLGRLTIGQTFDYFDLACYVIGVLWAVGLHQYLLTRRSG